MSILAQSGRGAAVALGLLWVVLMVPIVVLAGTPTSTQVQALLGIIAVAIVLVAKPFARRHIVPRLAMLAVASMLILRYWVWRLTETLPMLDAPVSFVVALLLFAVETYAIAVFFLTAFVNADPIDHDLPKRVRAAELPSVDILVPSYNEPVEMLSITLSAAKQIFYPRDKMRVVLCDDGGTDERCAHADPTIAAASRARRAELQKMCRELDVMYTTRRRNEHAKAGNMSAALEKLNGDLVVVFDADHVPSRDFLARTVGYFVENPRLFLVQTPHFFINLDPIQRNLGFARQCPSENEMFYANIHRGLDRWGGAFFCGSAAVLRRAALDEVGGFSGETITEDAETALDIHSRGWESMYLNRAMIAGLQPETFATFIQQRGRWATGMVQMLLLKNPLFRRGLSAQQRLCYVNSMSFWLFPLVRLGFLVIPLFYLFFGLEIFVATGEEVLAYMVSYLLVSFLVQNALFSHVRWPLISEVYEVAQAPYLGTQILKTILRPRAAKFAVTAKDETLSENFISPIYMPLLLLFALLAAGLGAAVLRWVIFPGDRTTIEVVGGWALFNFLLTGLAMGSISEKQQRRSVPRLAVDTPATVWLPGADDKGPELAARIVDASTGGVRLHLRTPDDGTPVAAQLQSLERGAVLSMRPQFPDAQDFEHNILVEIRSVSRSGEGLFLGLQFVADQPVKSRESVAFLIFSNSENWRRLRENETRPKGLLPGLFYVLWLSITTIPRTLRELLREPARRRRGTDDSTEKDVPVHVLTFGADFDPASPEADDTTQTTRDGLDFILHEKRVS
ncbi:UDP-forming cellulose synthase catalytic subunit [Roseinatronobacter alkalisoli]|uniref:Cellulose synthase catalytic subunit [UDP-forming] n=1 Tax=Roseinatronobacter alkalisoli TaxID=3028235 RepID=A0ABT5TE18_9RHOB|nr:UDP-forming cellulose synthase catalytic subunit [Roseinatronobacter sp. HJB301]MDD7973365.1 UDP-forming cellulose synthase catalytic subunit [Roseinatronobacter sp. HJB301]